MADARGKSIDLFLSRLLPGTYEPKAPSPGIHRQWMASCPNSTAHKHGDRKKSMSVSELANGMVLVKCFAGCSFTDIIGAIGVSKEQMRGDNIADPSDLKGISVNRMALAKRLDPTFLLNDCRLREVKDVEGKPNIRITYYDINGAEAWYRTRSRLRAKDGTYNQRGGSVFPYGVWRIPEWRKNTKVLHLVEGESNCWTLWSHGHAAIGIPGGGTVKKAMSTLVPDMVSWADTVYLWQDPDETGVVFVRDAAERLASLQFGGQILVAQHEVIKDASDLHVADPDSFQEELTNLLSRSVPPRATPPGRVPPPAGDLWATAQPWPPGYRLDWVGLAQRFAHRFRGQCLRDTTSRQFMFWNGCKWEADGEEGHAIGMASKVVDSLTEEAQSLQGADADSNELREQIISYRDKTRAYPNWHKPILSALAMPDLLPVKRTDFDREPMLFNCRNGLLDLESRTFYPPDSARLCACVSGTTYDASARCPQWDIFVDEIMDGDTDLVTYLQAMFGYTLTAMTDREEMYFLYGTGKNGKSSFVETMVGIMGDYYSKIDVGLILSTGWQSQSDNNTLAQKAQLVGKRFVSTTEIPQGRSFNDGVIKDLASNESIQACQKYGHPFRFQQTHKLWVFGNSRPTVKVTDLGFWRRIVPIPFVVTIPPEKRIMNLKERLRSEWPGILNWAIRGLDLIRQGYNEVPKAIQAQQRDYRNDSDLLAEFLQAETEAKVDHNHWIVDQTQLYKRYVEWCELNGDREVKRNMFYGQLTDRGYARSIKGNRRVFHGIRFLTPDEKRRTEIPPVDPYNEYSKKDKYSHKDNNGEDVFV